MSDETSTLDPIASVIHAAGSRHRRRKQKRWLRRLKNFKYIYIGYILVPIVMIGVFLTILAVDSFKRVEQSQDKLSDAFNSLNDKPATELTLQDYEHVDGALQALNASLLEANSRTKLLRYLSFLSHDNAARFNGWL